MGHLRLGRDEKTRAPIFVKGYHHVPARHCNYKFLTPRCDPGLLVFPNCFLVYVSLLPNVGDPSTTVPLLLGTRMRPIEYSGVRLWYSATVYIGFQGMTQKRLDPFPLRGIIFFVLTT